MESGLNREESETGNGKGKKARNERNSLRADGLANQSSIAELIRGAEHMG
jgi:hypothetical protein